MSLLSWHTRRRSSPLPDFNLHLARVVKHVRQRTPKKSITSLSYSSVLYQLMRNDNRATPSPSPCSSLRFSSHLHPPRSTVNLPRRDPSLPPNSLFAALCTILGSADRSHSRALDPHSSSTITADHSCEMRTITGNPQQHTQFTSSELEVPHPRHAVVSAAATTAASARVDMPSDRTTGRSVCSWPSTMTKLQ